MSDRDDPDEYVRVIEAEFMRRRGAPLLLSPRDWALIGEWREAGIPLRVVLQGIANVFDAFERRAPRGRRINSLSYCRQEVLSLHDLYRTLRGTTAGRPGSARETDDGARAVRRHLGRILRSVREAMAAASDAGFDGLVATLARAASEMTRLRKEARATERRAHDLESSLKSLDNTLLEAGRAALPEEERRAMVDDVAQALASERGRMNPAAYEVTHRALLARSLRRRLRLPRLTLFD